MKKDTTTATIVAEPPARPTQFIFNCTIVTNLC
jgi:hypothetical protein